MGLAAEVGADFDLVQVDAQGHQQAIHQRIDNRAEHVANHAALSRALEVAPPVISKIRHNTLPIGATILIRMHEISDFSIRELRELMAA